MQIQWIGQACFHITARDGRSVLIDPFQRVIGLQRGDFHADGVLFSHRHIDHYDPTAIPPGATVIEGTGRFNVAGLPVFGVPAFHYAR